MPIIIQRGLAATFTTISLHSPEARRQPGSVSNRSKEFSENVCSDQALIISSNVVNEGSVDVQAATHNNGEMCVSHPSAFVESMLTNLKACLERISQGSE